MINLHNYDVIVINTSGGKDSQTMMKVVCDLAELQDLDTSRLVAVHADLGRVEWVGTADLAERQAEAHGIEFRKISRQRGDLLDQVRQRRMWPSSTTRFCTSDQKRDQVKKILVQLQRERKVQGAPFRILNCMGLRAQESPARAKKESFTRNSRASTQSRIVDDWLPILEWTEEQVWSSIKESGVEYHQAYDLGMPRLSCVFCIFAPKAALALAGKHNRELMREYADVEREIGHTFRKDLSIAELEREVAEDAPIGELSGAWNM